MSEVISAILSPGATVTSVVIGDTTYVAGNTYSTLADALTAGETLIAVAEGSYVGRNIPGYSLTIVADDGAIFTGNSGGSNGGALQFNNYNFSVSGLTFSNNTATNVGGAVHVQNGTTTITNCTFSGNSAAASGGAISAWRGTTRVHNTTFTDNRNAIHVDNSAKLYIGNVTFADRGYAIDTYADKSNVYIDGLITLADSRSVINNNSTIQVQGGSFLTTANSWAKVIDAQFSGNWLNGNAITATDGYDLFTFDNDLYVTNTGVTTFAGYVVDATATPGLTLNRSGDAFVYAYNTIAGALAEQSSFTVESGTYTGQNVVNAAAQITFNEGAIIANTDGSTGAVFYVNAGNATLTLNGATCYNNNSSYVGGVIHNQSGTVIVENSIFDSNRAATSGSAISAWRGTTKVHNTTFTGNKNAIHVDNSAKLYVGDVTFRDNGYAIDTYANTSYVYIDGLITLADSRSVINNNSSIQVQGGSFLTTANSWAKVIDAQFSGNWLNGNAITATDGYDLFTFDNDLYVTNTGVTEVGGYVVDKNLPAGLTLDGGTRFVYVYNTIAAALEEQSNFTIDAGVYTESRHAITSARTISGDNAVLTGYAAGNGAVFGTSNSNLTLNGLTFYQNSATDLGGAVFNQYNAITITGCVFDENTSSGRGAGAVSAYRGTTNISGSTFFGNRATVAAGYGGAIRADVGTVNVSNCEFYGNYAGAGGGAIYVVSTASVTVSNSLFAEAGDTIQNDGSLTFSGTNTLASALSGSGSYTLAAGAFLNFTTAQDLSGIALTVDATGYAGTERTLATGVTSIGDYTITNKGEYEHLALYVENDNLYMAEATVVPTDTPQSSFTGGTLNIMTDGTITGAYVGIRNPAANADVKNVISGGTVGNSLIGGALVSSGSTATLGTVTLDISGDAAIVGGTANGGMVYTAGYAYGANPNVLDSSATLTVAKSVLNLTEGSVPAQNLYAGAHARKGAYTVVAQTEVNVSGGSFGRVYGGGWAEKVGLSEVGSSEIAISGGTVDYIYAGGGNAEGGETVVTGNVSISVSGDASVGIVFLAGKNQNCSITGNVTMTVLGSDKTMTRVSGYNANGDNNTGGTTMLDLRTSLDVEYLDHVDIVRIAEGETLNVSADLWYEAASALKIDFDLDGALDTDWTAMSGVGMNIYRAAQYTIDGGDVVYSYDSESGKLVNGTTESGYGLDFSEANKVKFVTIA